MSVPPITHADARGPFPVCCATDLSAEEKDRLLRLNQDYGDRVEHFLVFVDSLEQKYTEVSEHGYSTASDPNSPFKGKSAEECALLLQQLRRNGAEINFEYFAIIDPRFHEDDSVLLVVAPLPGDGEFGVVRAASELASTTLMCYMIGAGPPLEDDQEKARKAPDGVLRG